MWRIESEGQDAGAPYDRRAAIYDRLVRSSMYNRLAWSCAPDDYAEFAAAAFASAGGPLLEAAAGSAAATAELHARSQHPTVLVDLSRAMLARAARRIAAAGADGEANELPARVRLVQADLLALPFSPGGFNAVLGLGLTHLFDDLPALVAELRAQLAPGGQALSRWSRRAHPPRPPVPGLLHRAGEVAVPRTARELHVALGRPEAFRTTGCMAYATLDSCV